MGWNALNTRGTRCMIYELTKNHKHSSKRFFNRILSLGVITLDFYHIGMTIYFHENFFFFLNVQGVGVGGKFTWMPMFHFPSSTLTPGTLKICRVTGSYGFSLMVMTASPCLFTGVEYEPGIYFIDSHFCPQSSGQFSQQGTMVGFEGNFRASLYPPKVAGDLNVQ